MELYKSVKSSPTAYVPTYIAELVVIQFRYYGLKRNHAYYTATY